MVERLCPRCKERLCAVRGTGGVRPWCRECEAAYAVEYRRRKPDKNRDAVRRYQQSEKGKAAIAEWQRRYYLINRVTLLEKQCQYSQTEEGKAARRRYQQRPEVKAAKSAADRRYYLKKKAEKTAGSSG